MDFLLSITILIISVVCHEISHGYAAYYLGDMTARNYGRLSFNPFKHFDLVGSFIVPTASYLLGGFIFGWAKPVPYDPRNIHPYKKWKEAWIAFAGPLANICLAVGFALLIRFEIFNELSEPLLLKAAYTFVFINLILALFNLLPIPPLDGSKIIFPILPSFLEPIRAFLEKYNVFILIFFIIFLWQYIVPVVRFLFINLTGITA